MQGEVRQPTEDTASYVNGNSIRNAHRRRQDSQERILLNIGNKNSIRNDHSTRQGSQDWILQHIWFGIQ